MTGGLSLVVLAGGLSLRMGRDKATLSTGGPTITEHIIERLTPVVDEVILAAGAQELEFDGARTVHDHFPGAGPLAGIHAGLRAAAFDHAWVVACDYPDVDPAVGRCLARAITGFDATVPLIAGQAQGVCAVYSVHLTALIEQLIASGRRSVGALLESCSVRYLEEAELRQVEPELRSFRNLNTPADYDEWLRSTAAGH
jgi:molybdopterin-guanine dinucleotide biosynthesis protein A